MAMTELWITLQSDHPNRWNKSIFELTQFCRVAVPIESSDNDSDQGLTSVMTSRRKGDGGLMA